MPRRSRPFAADEQTKAITEAQDDLVYVEYFDSSRGKFDGQRYPVQKTAEFSDEVHVTVC